MGVDDSHKVIVIGGGLAGLSAAHTVLERGGTVFLLDKNPFLGGNSTKATSGINGALTKVQSTQGIPDSAEKFEEDTAISYAGGKKSTSVPPLVTVLTRNSGSAVDWLIEKFGLDLSLVSRLGGHSFPRTHRGKERFPGFTITYALMEKLEEIAEKSTQARVLTRARATRILTEGSRVVGVEYEHEGKLFQEKGHIIVATGGFAADFTDDSLLKKIRPDLLHLPTTNGDHCTGDGIKMALEIGANAIDLEHVQVHPTGLVHPDEPDAKVKFLAAEALRGVGGLLLDRNGKRFSDELGRRDYVSGEMNKNQGPFRLILNSKGGKEIEWHCKHYMGRGLMKHYSNGEALAKDMGILPETLKETFTKYNEGAKNNKDEFGKKYFDNAPFLMDDGFYVAVVCTVLHYCMGGLQITPEAQVVGKNGPIPGLYATGEVVGGVHGINRLGGNSLLDCVVFGRVAGETASRHLQEDSSTVGDRITTISKHLQPALKKNDNSIGITVNQATVQTRIKVHPQHNKLTLSVSWDQQSSPSINSTSSHNPSPQISSASVPTSNSNSTSTSTTASSKALPPVEKKMEIAAPGEPIPSKIGNEVTPTNTLAKIFTYDEVANHKSEKDCWVVINGKVLDVTHFLKDHPGGKKSILLYAGKDASEEFNMLHKPNVIEKYAPHTVIGTIDKTAQPSETTTPSSPAPQPQHEVASPPTDPSKSETTPAKPDIGGPVYDAPFSEPNNPLSLRPVLLPTPSDKPARNSGGTAGILDAERAKASFHVEKLTNILDGGPEKTKKRRWIISPSIGTDMSDKYYFDRAKLMREHVRHFIQVHEDFMGTYVPTREEVGWMIDNTMNSGSMMNHWGLFLPTIVGQTSPEQQEWWLLRAATMSMIGCYAQTELGHGSNVRALQTTATYDKATQEFVLNTPNLQAIKWWPGTLGKIATHALVYAQLIIDKQEYGVHPFFVQIRDENHRPLPGFEIGDLGPKMGDSANDTGFLRIDNVRIPRQFLLGKYQHVTPEGKYVKSEEKTNDKVHYATMMFTRGVMVKGAGGALARAVTIATRYSLIRRQGFVDGKTTSFKSEERPIIDWQIQRYRIFKQLALSYAIKFTGKWMTDKFSSLNSEGGVVITDFTEITEIAATASGLKAICTFLASQGIEDCRKCCGGNGYLLSSGVAALSSDYVWQTTAEGDFIILILQTARFLYKTYIAAKNGQRVSGPCSYLARLTDKDFALGQVHQTLVSSVEEFVKLEHLQEIFAYRALCCVVGVSEQIERKTAGNDSNYDAASYGHNLELCHAVQAHCHYFLLCHFIDAVREIDDPALASVLTKLCAFYACSFVLDEQWGGVLDGSQMRIARSATSYLLDQLRPEACALVDAFDIPDRVLNSTLGRSDGNVYESLFRSALKSPLNQSDPFDGYYDVVRPRLDIDFLKNGNKVYANL